MTDEELLALKADVIVLSAAFVGLTLSIGARDDVCARIVRTTPVVGDLLLNTATTDDEIEAHRQAAGRLLLALSPKRHKP